MEKRCSFELFKSNVCHRLKEQGDIDFLIETLKEEAVKHAIPEFLKYNIVESEVRNVI